MIIIIILGWDQSTNLRKFLEKYVDDPFSMSHDQGCYETTKHLRIAPNRKILKNVHLETLKIVRSSKFMTTID